MNLKKILAAIFAAMMCVAVMSFAALADDNEAKIGETEYPTIAEAIEEADDGDTIEILCTDIQIETEKAVTISTTAKSTITIDAPQATLNAWEDITFIGENVVSVFSATYYNHTVTIGEGASLEITGTGRATLGYGNIFNITGTIADAKNTDKATVTPSLIIPGGISITGGNDAEMNVENAYVIIGSTTSKNKEANGEFTLSFVNSIAEFTDQLTLSEPTSGKNPTFNLNIKDSVLTTGTKLIVAVPNTTTVIDNSTVTLGTYFRNSGNMTLKNESVLTGSTIQFGENGGNDGTTIVDNSTFNISATSAGHALDGNGTGEIVLKNGAVADIGYITDSTVKIEDATVEFAGKVVDTESVKFDTPDDLDIIVNADGVIEVKLVAVKIGDTPYYSLDEALDDAIANNLSEIEIDVLDDIAFSSKLSNFKKVTFTGTNREQTFDLNINSPFETNVALEFNDLTVSRLDKEWLNHYFYATGGLTFNDCKMIGLYVVTAQDTDFTGCDFYNDDSFGDGNYSIWLYNCFDGVEVNITDCTFDVYERAIKMYGDGYRGNMVLNISETEFVSRTADKTVVEMAYANATGVGSMDLNISEDSTAEGFDAPEHIDGEANAWFDVELGSGVSTLSTVKIGEEIVYDDCVAKIGDDRFASLQAAVDAAAEAATSENPVTVQLLAGEYEFGTVTLPVLDGVTIKGAANDGTVIVNSVLANSGAKTDSIKNFTIDGVVFDNAGVYINAWTAGMVFENWAITNCTFENYETPISPAVGGAPVQFNLASGMLYAADTALDGFTFTGNTVTNIIRTNASAINSQAMKGRIVIENNTFDSVNFNAIQLQNVPEEATVSIKDNVFTNIGRQIIHLNNNIADIKVNENVFVKTDEDKLYISHLSTEIEASDNFYGIGTSTEDAVFDENYASKLHYVSSDVPAPVVLGYYTDTELTEYVDIAVAKIGDDRFASLQAAVDATTGKTGDFTITVLNGTYDEDFIILQTIGRNLTIVPETPGKVIFKGNISINGNRGVIKEYTGGTVTIDGIVFDGSEKTEAHNFIADQKSNSGIKEDKVTTYSHKVTVKNCTFIGSESADVVAFREHQAGAQNYYFYNCTATGLHSFIQAKNVGGDNGLIVENCTITGCKEGINLNSTKYFKMTGTTVDVAGYGLRGGQGSVTNTEMKIELSDNTITAGEHAVILRAGAEDAVMTITSGSYTGAISAIAEANVAISGGNYSIKPDDAYLADGFEPVKLADGSFVVLEDTYTPEKVEVVFAPVSATEEEIVYNINIEAAGEVINRLNSGDLTFVLTQGEYGANKYQIIDIAGDDIQVNPVDDKGRYEFHFSTKTDVENDTNKTITIAKVKFTGYGKFSFKVADATTNAVHTTTVVDNVVDTFVPNPDETKNEGTLDVSAVLEGLEIKTPTRKLTINVDFPNAVENKEAAYQQMKVVISGDDLAQALVIDLGEECAISAYADIAKPYAKVVAEFVDGAYVIEISDLLIKNNTYFVEVSGAGYRTANHTVQMTTEKTLNFWNNVKDAEKAIEVYEAEGQTVEAGKTKVTFLAGDIVHDGLINIYDLSAVVSYFGEEDLAKYDLNRDGKVDSKDVAYVLVSWNK